MKVLMTADAVGGVWVYCLELARALVPFGTEVELAVMGPPPTPDQRADAVAAGVVAVHQGQYALEWEAWPWADVDAAGQWLLGLAAAGNVDVVHLNGYAHGALPWPVPALVVTHSCVYSWWEAVEGRPTPPEWDEYGRRVSAGLAAASAIVAPSSYMADALGRHHGLVHGQDVHVIPNGRSTEWLEPVRQAPGPKEDLVLASGRAWDKAKNVGLLEDVAAVLDWPLVIAGARHQPASGASWSPTADGRQPLLAPAPFLAPGTNPAVSPLPTPTPTPGRATFVGQLSQAELAPWLSSARVYASPALYEPFGLGVLEAAQAGCALVLSDIASFRENWEGTAVFAHPRRPQDWAQALGALSADPEGAAGLGALARARAGELSAELMGLRYTQLYRDLNKKARAA